MSRRTLAVAFVAQLLAACAVGPRYEPGAAVAPETRVGAGESSPAARTFFDSLTAARTADTLAPQGLAAPAIAPPIDDARVADLAWLELLRDTTLVALVREALNENRDLQAAVARIREYRAQVGVSRSPLYPDVSLIAGASANKVSFGSGNTATFEAFQLTGNVAWELDFWGKTRRGVEAAQADLEGREAGRRAVVLSLVSDVATGYLELLELDQELMVAESTLVSRRATLALAQSRFREGLTSELDVRQFEAQVGGPAAALAAIQRQRAQQENRLSLLLGSAPRPIPRGTSLAAAVAALKVPDSLSATLLARRPDVQEAERALAAATARIGQAEAARFPTIAITGYYGTQPQNIGSLFAAQAEVYQLQGGVKVPLFTGGRLVNQQRVAEARAEQARAAWQQTALGALREASDALVAVRTASDETVAQETQTLALRRALHLASLRYRTGVASYLEVLEAQRGLFVAELALSQAQLRQLSAAVQLYRALGGGWEEAD